MPKFEGSLISKLPRVGTTIFSQMSLLAQQHKAINLSQGFPDFDCDPVLIGYVEKAMRGGYNQYAPMPGALPLREMIAEKTEKLYGAKYDVESEIIVTAGATQAIYTAIAAVVRENDEVIIIEPAYDCYQPAVEVNGGKCVFVKLNETDYSVDWNSVKKVISHHTRMIIINTPHNPTGAVWSEKDMLELDKLTKKTDIIVLSDEVYEHMVLDGKTHQSVARYEELRNRSFIISSFGKTIHTTGWKVGYCIGPANLMNEFRKVHQFLVFCVNAPMQYAIAEYLKHEDNYLQVADFYTQKRNRFNELIKSSRFEFAPTPGTYFQCVNYSKITDEKDTDFAIRLIKEFGVASIPLSVFYHKSEDNKILRFCFAKKDETLERAAEKICKI